MSKIVFFDIDGTLWDDNMIIPDSTREAIKLLRKNGHKSFLCSGRSRGNIRSKDLLGLGFDGIVAACGNHVEMDGKILYERILPDEEVKRVVEILDECQMPVVLEGPKHLWISKYGFELDPFVLYLFKEMGKDAISLDGYKSDIYINKFSADITVNTDYERVKRELSADYQILEHGGNVVEFVPKNTSKATGIEWICNYLGIPMSDTYALGDSINDLDMLRAVGHGIAMGNGTDVAKEAAEYVTDDINEDGLFNALKHFGLI